MFKEGLRFVKGEGNYIDDFVLKEVKNYFSASIVRSPYAHAMIRSIDKSDAEKLNGVIKVITFNDIRNLLDPFPLSLDINLDFYPMAREKTLYYGEPVAVIIAKDDYVAEDAKELLQIDYEPLEPVVSIENAINSRPIHPTLKSNVILDKTLVYGKFEYEIKKSSILIEERIRFPRYSSSPLETYEILARYNGEEYEIFSNFQGPFTIHYLLTKALKSKVVLKGPRDIGGSFGIKSAIYPYMALIAVASRVVKRPVKWIETRSEHITSSSVGAERESLIRIYGDKDGIINAIEMDLIDNLGAYPRPPEPGNLLRNHGNLTGAYDIKGLKVRYRAVLTNTIPTGLNRGYGGPHLYFALETVIDSFAREIGMDPIDVRLKNVFKKTPYETLTGGKYNGFSCYSVLKRMKEIYEKIEGEKRGKVGIGVSLVVEPSGTNIGYLDLARESKDYLPKSAAQDVVIVQIDPYGKVKVMVNGTNEGQGHETIISEIVSKRLGVNPDDVEVLYSVDTSRPWVVSSGSYSSRFTPIVVQALNNALDQLENRLLSATSEILGVQKSELKIENGRVRTISGNKSISVRHLIGTFYWDPAKLKGIEGGLVAVGYYQSPYADDIKEGKINSSISYGCMGHVVEVLMDETDIPRISRYVVVHDAGRILNENFARGQIIGSTFHGIEVSLYASLEYNEEGIPITQTFAEYGVMTAMESPKVEIEHLESDSNHLAGLGEGGTMAAPPAVFNAIRSLVEVKNIPLFLELTSKRK
ncbi:xanthine dehydrogenase family protein molybdopterin-binding subunit [Saccharolobus solfataricus]|uniref:Xanthine dehydrogenase family protein molybdopterin-binding subunit n=1 Tax=Saccharolobus solfataricus TaxID=2287 RepID=A0A7S9IHL4_SACSO|nr:xanthine dehydrogenase family protein molybdopterin-binding subunit [Saccharolobus solfataricus]QPG49268.1 xanthine dehydrogenase family protein molybdopterin-binding subunit [Saccharolobus solfataricus]